MKISVVIPAFNAERFLPRSLASVFAQTLPPHEVIVVTMDRRTAPAKSRPLSGRAYQQENRGLAAARNTGIQDASGEWIALLDADDSWEPEKLARQVAAIRPDTVLAYTGARHFDDHGTRAVQSAIAPPTVRKCFAVQEPNRAVFRPFFGARQFSLGCWRIL